MSMSVEDLREWAADIQTETNTVDKRIAKAISRTTDHLYSISRAAAPRLTGQLHDSIAKEAAGLEGEVYTDTVQGVMQEFGTVRHPPQPWLLVHEPAIERRLAEEVDRVRWRA